MTIAIDFDGTFTQDPTLWANFIITARKRGHRVIMVTARFPDMTSGMEFAFEVFGRESVFFTGNCLKGLYMERKGISVDVWIDDMPQTISDPRIYIDP